MNLAKIIIKIEKTRRKLYNEGHNGNPKKLLKISQELDLLMNEYFKLKGETTTLQESCSVINSVPDKESTVSRICYDQQYPESNDLAYQ